MPSLTSIVILWLLRLLLKRRINADMDVVGERARLEKFGRFAKALPANISADIRAGQDFATCYLRNSNKASDLVILYLHGGGFLWEMHGIYQGFVAGFCQALQAEACLPRYRLAPEHPYPAAPEDCFAAYVELLNSGVKPRDIVLMGDSAGGNLVLATLLRIRQGQLAMPAGAVLLSPVTDLAEQSSSWVLNGWAGRDPMFPKDAFGLLRHYRRDHPPTDPLMSPYYGEFSGCPPMLFIVGETEALLEDSIAVAKKVRAAHIPVAVRIWRGMPHVFPLLDILPEARKARVDIVEFIRARHQGLEASRDEPLLSRH